MVKNNSNDVNLNYLIFAINANNWNEIYRLATELNLHVLRIISNYLKDKMESETFLEMTIKDIQQDNSLRLRQWLESNKYKFSNEYMYSLLKNCTFEGSRYEIDMQTSALKELISKYPNRWETFLLLAISWLDDRSRSLQLLKKAQELNPEKEGVFLQLIVVNTDDLEQVLEYGNKGYALNKNSLFLILMAKKLETSGRVDQAKEYYQKIINDEPEDSYISRKAKKELRSSCFIATLVYNDKYAPEVETLRFIRDRYLMNTIGLVFIKMYYRYSPTIAESIRDMPMLIKFIKLLLNSFLSFSWRLRVLNWRFGKALHWTVIPLRSISASKLNRS